MSHGPQVIYVNAESGLQLLATNMSLCVPRAPLLPLSSPINRRQVPCINAEFGCGLVLPRRRRAAHLASCPASVVLCMAEWNRWPQLSPAPAPDDRHDAAPHHRPLGEQGRRLVCRSDRDKRSGDVYSADSGCRWSNLDVV